MLGLSVKRQPPLGGTHALSLDVHVGHPGRRSLPVRCASPSRLRLLSEPARGHGYPLARQTVGKGSPERKRPDRQRECLW